MEPRDVDEIWVEVESILEVMEDEEKDLSWDALTANVERLDELSVEYDRSLRLSLDRMQRGEVMRDPWDRRQNRALGQTIDGEGGFPVGHSRLSKKGKIG